VAQARIFADFADAAADGCLHLSARATLDDVRRLGVQLLPGLVLALSDGERMALAQVTDCEACGARHARLLSEPAPVESG